MSNKVLLRISEVQELTGWSRAKCYAMASSGEIPTIRSGRSVRVPIGPFMRWIEGRTKGGSVLDAA